MEEYIVQLENITKSFKNVHAVENISLNIKEGEFLTLLGPSGCGKTTTLRMIAGFEKPTKGNIRINGEIVNDIEPYNREINTVFQNYSLFPHMTIFNNVAFGLKMKKVKKKEITERVNKVLGMVQLKEYGDRKPSQLSGGQQQRIAIARAIVNNPKVLLLDEPLGALDLKLRKQMQLELKQLQQKLGITFIYVTHDQEEALTMSDRIVVMNGGHIEQMDIPRNIYEKPESLFVASFIGETNILKANVSASDSATLNLQLGSDTILAPKSSDVNVGDELHFSVRPENIQMIDGSSQAENKVKATIQELIYIGSATKFVTSLEDGQKVIIQSLNDVNLKEGDQVFLTWNKEDSVVYKEKNEEKKVREALLTS